MVWGVEPDLVDAVQPLSRYLRPDPAILAALSGGTVPRVILGTELAANVYAAIGDTVILTSVNEETRPSGHPTGQRALRRRRVSSRRACTSSTVDSSTARARRVGSFLGYPPDGASLLGVKVADLMRADRVADALGTRLGRDFYATDWMALNQNLFQWIKLEKIIMVVLLGMIILIAGFNIIGILTMMVGERRREIGILLAMGARRGQVMGIFLLNGLWLGAVGIVFGSADRTGRHLVPATRTACDCRATSISWTTSRCCCSGPISA